MNKLSLIVGVVLVALLASCKSSTPAFKHEAYLVDLRTMTDDGFFITESNSVGFDYQPIGVMTLFEYSGEDKTYVVTQQEVQQDLNDGIYVQSMMKRQSKHWRTADSQSALNEMVRVAKEQGANGIINLSIKYNYYIYNEVPMYLESVEVRGMLIRR